MKRLFSNAPFSRLGGPVAVKALYAGTHLLLAGMFIATCISLWAGLRPQHPLALPEGNTTRPGLIRTTAPVEKIIAAHLFGQASPAPVHAAAPPPANILLAGIVFGTDAGHSRAILSVDGRAVVAAVGDTVSAGIRIADIKPGYVQLEQAGAQMMLRLRFTGSPSGAQTVGAVAVNARRGNPPSSDSDAGVSSAVASTAPALKPPSLVPSATPLEQMRALRSQLVRGKPPRYLPGSPPGQH